MALTRSLPTQHPSGLPLIDERRITAGRFARNADGTARTGVLPANTNPIVTGRASMGYDVAVFNALTARTVAGAEEIANDATTIVTTTAAPGANSRIDAIWVRAQFVILGDANNDVVFGVTQGATNVSPVKPAIPAGAFELATATIPSTATTTLSSGVVITQSHPYTATAGGVVLMRNRLDLDAWSAPAGAMARTIDTDLLWVRRAAPSSGPLTWYVAPGQQLAYMAANSGQDILNQIIGTVASTITLPVGQRLRVRSSRVGGSAVSAGSIAYALRILNSATDVTGTTGDKVVTSRGYQNGGGFVISVPGTDTTFVTTAVQKVSAGLFVSTGVWTVYAPDGQELWIESA